MRRVEEVDLRLTLELAQAHRELFTTSTPPTICDVRRWGSAWSRLCRRRYGIARVCRTWGIARSTFYRKAKNQPHTLMEQETTDAALVQKLRELIEASPFPAERHRKLWARLQRSGLKASRERIRRLLREHHLLPQYGNIRTSRPNEMWGIDSVKVRTADGHWSFVLYAVDHCTGECLGIEVVREETVDAWLYLLLCIVLRVFGTLASEAARGLKLRCDNFPQFREARFRTDLGRLGIQITHSFRLRPEGNGIAERFARTLRENRLAVMNFADPGELRREMFAFRALYNEKYLLARWGYKTPEEVRAQFPDAPKTRTNGANLQLIQGGKPSPRVNLQALVAAFGLSLAEKLLPSTHQPVPPGDTRNGSGT